MAPASGSVVFSAQAGQVPSTAPAALLKPPNAPIPGLARPSEDNQPQLTQPTALAAGPTKPSSRIEAQPSQPSSMHQALSNPNHMKQPQYAVHPEAQQPADMETDAVCVLRPPSNMTWIQSYAGGNMATLGQGNLLQPSAPDYLLHAPDASFHRAHLHLLPPALAHLDPHDRHWVPTLLPVNPFRIAQLAHRSASERQRQHTPDTCGATPADQTNKKHVLDHTTGAAASKKRRLASVSASAAASVPDVHSRHGLHEQHPVQLTTHDQRSEYPHDGALLQDHGLQEPWGISESNPGCWQQPEEFLQQPQGSWQQPQSGNAQRHFQDPAPNLPHQQPSNIDSPRWHLAHADGLDQHPGQPDWHQASPGGDLHQQHVVAQQQYGNEQQAIGQPDNSNGHHPNGNGQHTNGNGQHPNGNGQLTNGNGQHAHDSGQHANLNGQYADADWQQSGHDQVEQNQHAGRSRSKAMPQQQSASRSRLHSKLMHFSALASPTEVRYCHSPHIVQISCKYNNDCA